MTSKPHILVIDPAMRIAEVECFNRLALSSPLPLTYHLPAMRGMQSLAADPVESARGIVILGSASSVHDRLPWQHELETWLRPLLERGMPTLGICYGHQMLATMYGGKVGFVAPDQRKLKGFREVTLTRSAGPWSAPARGPLCISHKETVTEVPPDFESFATSEEVPTDGLRHRHLPIFTLQPHPEATPEFLQSHGIAHEPGGAPLTFGHQLVDAFLRYAAEFPERR
ncbi:gamma-glutamyl-gamma-aminobutyrate hydrolase family protein [Myxococcaceae bacterium GXIMD 01537]